MTLNVNTGAQLAQQAVDDQVARAAAGTTLLTPAQVAVLLAAAYDTYAKEGTLPGADLTAGGTLGLLEAGFVTDNTSATVTRIATAICNYWASNVTPGTPAHGGSAVLSVTILAGAQVAAMETAINNYITTTPGDGWVGFYNETQNVVSSVVCTVVELVGGNPTPFTETIS